MRMLVSTKGRYALRIMIDLAEHQRDGYIPLKETAGRQGISEKYLEVPGRYQRCSGRTPRGRHPERDL